MLLAFLPAVAVASAGINVQRKAPCFVLWSDRRLGKALGLNFVSEYDAAEVHCCMAAPQCPLAQEHEPASWGFAVVVVVCFVYVHDRFSAVCTPNTDLHRWFTFNVSAVYAGCGCDLP